MMHIYFQFSDSYNRSTRDDGIGCGLV